MLNLIRSRNRKGYGALALFLIVYLAALGLVIAPKSLLSSGAPETATEG